MRKIAIWTILCTFCAAAPLAQEAEPQLDDSQAISEAYLEQARNFRDEGRYELSRQSYAQALATCADNENLEIIKRELEGVELLLRTLR